jgi:hypothetical protein
VLKTLLIFYVKTNGGQAISLTSHRTVLPALEAIDLSAAVAKAS